MSRVSGRATRLFIEGLETSGADVPAILLPFAPAVVESLRDVGGFVPWEIFAALVESAAKHLGGPEALEAIGRGVVRAPSYRFLRVAAGHVLSTRQLLEIAARWSSPSLFPDVRLELQIDRAAFVFHLGLPLGAAPCVAFFHLTAGVTSALPLLLDLPVGVARVTTDGVSGSVWLSFPREMSRRERLLRRARSFFSGEPLVEELVLQNEEVARAYRLLIESRQEFRAVLANAPVAVAIHRDGRILWANAATARLLGWHHPEQLVGHSIFANVHPEQRERVRARNEASAADSRTEELVLVRRDGTTAVCELAPAQVVEFEGAAARLVIAVDVTEKVAARQQLALADRMASLGTLAASVAHEINNPLTYVQLNLQSLVRDLRRGDREATELAADSALEGVERVRAIVSDLRTFARADEETVGPVDLDDVVAATLRLAGKSLEAAARLELALGAVPHVRGNRTRLGQVVLALAINAHEAMEERGGGGTIRIATFVDEGDVVLEVADDGSGIGANDLSRVFQPFFTTKPVGRGTGLGLAICHRIVSTFGGTITITSDPTADGLRTFVRVRLPASSEVEPKSPREVSMSTRRRRILLIDDEPGLARALARLVSLEHDIELVTSGRDALDLLARDPAFDLVLCDVMMPDVDGIEVFEQTRDRNPELARKFVFMTGGAFTPRSRAFLASCDNHRLEKPFGIEQIRALVQRCG